MGLNCKALRTGWQRGRGESREGLSGGRPAPHFLPRSPPGRLLCLHLTLAGEGQESRWQRPDRSLSWSPLPLCSWNGKQINGPLYTEGAKSRQSACKRGGREKGEQFCEGLSIHPPLRPQSKRLDTPTPGPFPLPSHTPHQAATKSLPGPACPHTFWALGQNLQQRLRTPPSAHFHGKS